MYNKQFLEKTGNWNVIQIISENDRKSAPSQKKKKKKKNTERQ